MNWKWCCTDIGPKEQLPTSTKAATESHIVDESEINNCKAMGERPRRVEGISWSIYKRNYFAIGIPFHHLLFAHKEICTIYPTAICSFAILPQFCSPAYGEQETKNLHNGQKFTWQIKLKVISWASYSFAIGLVFCCKYIGILLVLIIYGRREVYGRKKWQSLKISKASKSVFFVLAERWTVFALRLPMKCCANLFWILCSQRSHCQASWH